MKTLEEIITEKHPELKLNLEGERLEEVLLKSESFGEDELLDILSDFYGIPRINDLNRRSIDLDLIKILPIGFAKRYKIIPIEKIEGTVKLAIAPPLNLYVLDEVKSLFGTEVSPLLASGQAVIDCINRVYERAAGIHEGIEGQDDGLSGELPEPRDLLESDDEAPIIKFVNSLFFQAVKEKASDVHIECFERDVIVRYRKDGMLHKVTTVPKKVQSAVISRVKIMAELDIAEKRKPQDGRIRIKIAGRDVDVRISTVPTSWGESVVMRLLDRSSVLLSFEQIGLEGDKLKTINSLIHRPYGIILVTGPTGSGKTTTLYAALQRINSPDKKIITIEDPVEYQIEGINQIQVNPKVDLTFANGLRSVLRQDPDVILVGEIRDRETADIAIHASLTGHLVFATLHTNDASSAITRLVDMGIEPFLVASSLLAVVAQRLVRKLCVHCREEYTATELELKSMGNGDSSNTNGFQPPSVYRTRGCESCAETGYSGRRGIFEILMLDEGIRDLIMTSSDSVTIKKRAMENGLLTLRADAMSRVMSGETSFDEIYRVTDDDEL